MFIHGMLGDFFTAISSHVYHFKRIATLSRCKCRHCKTDLLEGALEYRCCKEVTHTVAKMVFDGSIKRINCITEHEDYGHHSAKSVLEMVAGKGP